MKSLFERAKQTHTAMMQKVKDALQRRDDMKMQMEEAFTTKEAVGTETDFCGFLHLCRPCHREKKSVCGF